MSTGVRESDISGSVGAYGSVVRWESLFADLEGQLDAAQRADLRAELAERVRAERAVVDLADRLRSATGARLRVWLAGGGLAEGEVVDVATQWLLLADGPRRVLVPAHAVVGLAGAPPVAAPPAGVVERRLSLGHALRALARDRVPVVVAADGYELAGRVERVGADHLDVLSTHGDPRVERTVPFAALRAVRTV